MINERDFYALAIKRFLFKSIHARRNAKGFCDLGEEKEQNLKTYKENKGHLWLREGF